MTKHEKQKIVNSVNEKFNIQALIDQSQQIVNLKRQNKWLSMALAVGLFLTAGFVFNMATTQSYDDFVRDNFVLDERLLLKAIQAKEAAALQPASYPEIPEIILVYSESAI